MNRVNVFAIHRCINEGYGLIRIFTEKIRISPTKLWHVCTHAIHIHNSQLASSLSSSTVLYVVLYSSVAVNTTVAVLTLLAGVAALKKKTVVGDGCRACNIDGI